MMNVIKTFMTISGLSNNSWVREKKELLNEQRFM